MIPEEIAAWRDWDIRRRGLLRVRTQECWELLDEVKDLEGALVVLSGLLNGEMAENGLLRAENAQWRARVCLGGIPPVSGAPHWTNVAAPPPPSASDESAPPLRRSDTSSSFRGGESRG